MPELSAEEIWQVALSRMEKVPEIRASVASLFRSLIPGPLRDGVMTLLAPNAFVIKMVRERHTAVIEQYLGEVAGAGIGLSVELNPNPPNPKESMIVVSPAPQSIVADMPARPVAREPESDFRSSVMDDRYTLDNFVIADCNRFALAKFLQLIRMYAEAGSNIESANLFERFFVVYGDSGVGKSHLAVAFIEALRRENPYIRAAYTTSIDFVDHCVLASGARTRVKRFEEFYDFYRNLDVWVVDDVQVLVGTEKEFSIEQFFAIVNLMVAGGRLVVVVCDIPPHTLGQQDNRYRTRLQQGGSVDLKVPPPDVIEMIVRKKLEVWGMTEQIPEEAIQYVVTYVQGNPRIIEGALGNVCSYVSLRLGPLTEEALTERLRAYEHRHGALGVSVSAIVQVAAELSGKKFTERDITGKARGKEISRFRQAAVSCSRILLPSEVSLGDIGVVYGGRDHSTILYAINKAKEVAREDPCMLTLINQILARFGREPMEWEELPSSQ